MQLEFARGGGTPAPLNGPHALVFCCISLTVVRIFIPFKPEVLLNYMLCERLFFFLSRDSYHQGRAFFASKRCLETG